MKEGGYGMGQRHQVYVRLPKVFYNKGNCNNRGEATVGIHHQWLWGATAIRSLKNLLTFVKNNSQDTYPKHQGTNTVEFERILAAVYSIDIDAGYFSSVYKFQDSYIKEQQEQNPNKEVKGQAPECEDPRNGDNNNGVTVIDLTGNKPTYCFLSIGGLEGLHKSKETAYDHFYPISASEWIALHYSDSWTKEKISLADNQDTKEIEKWVKFLESFKTITPKRLMEIFPSMKKDIEKGIKDHIKRTPNSVKLIKQLAKKR